MIKAIVLVAFFLTLALADLLDIGLAISTGLSAKNAFLFMLLMAILCTKVVDHSKDGVQLPAIHLLFFLLIADASLSVFYMQFVSGDTAGYGLFSHVASIKSYLVDMYLMLFVFFYGVESRVSAMKVAKLFLAVVSLMNLITLLDTLNVASMGLVGTGENGRLVGPLGGSNEYAVYLAFFIPVLVLAGMGVGNGLLRTVYLLGGASSFALLIQTGSRGGFVSLIGGTVLAAWWLRGGYNTGKAFKAVTVLIVLAIMVVASILTTSDDLGHIIQQRIARSTEGNIDEISAGRLWIWSQGLEYQMARPWTLITGVGWATFWDKIGMGPHSAYVNFLFSVGILGLGFFLAIIYRIFTVSRKAYFSTAISVEEYLLIGGMTIGWFGMVIAMSTGTIFKPWTFVWPFTGLCLRIAYCLLVESRDPGDIHDRSPLPAKENQLTSGRKIPGN